MIETPKKWAMKSVRYRIEAQGLAKIFSGKVLFADIDINVMTGNAFSITGPNGSGKTTLLKILAGLSRPSKGTVAYKEEFGRSLNEEWHSYIGYTGPLINPYDELTALENMKFVLKKNIPQTRMDFLIDRFDLRLHRDKKLKHYSSGMKQRLRLILAELNNPPILLLDEPSTNLDGSGKEILYSYLNAVKEDKIIILATNDKEEENLFGGGVSLG